MVPRVAQRGSGFVGAGKYYLHDKQANTNERVAWTHTLNLPTNNPEQALKFMAFTAKHAEELKRDASVSTVGRKSNGKFVYTYSLAWSPEEAPTREHMESAAIQTLELLGLVEHEVVMVAHQETDHDHVHIIANLVNPYDGRIASPSRDYLTLSKWAEAYEKEHGKVYCHQRVENNQKRQEFGKEQVKVTYREQKLVQAELISDLYQRSDSSTAFRAALAEQNLTLCAGDRRGLVLVDSKGKVSSLSRQLNGVKAKDMRERLKDLEGLPEAKLISAQHQQLQTQQTMHQATQDKDRQEQQDFEQKIAAKLAELDTHQEKPQPSQERELSATSETRKEHVIMPPSQLPQNDNSLTESEWFLKELDAKQEAERSADRRRRELSQQQKGFYNREKTETMLKEIEIQLVTAKGKSKEELEQQRDGLQQNLSSMDQRMQEQQGALEREIEAEQGAQTPSPERDREAHIAALKAEWKNQRSQQKDRGYELGM